MLGSSLSCWYSQEKEKVKCRGATYIGTGQEKPGVGIPWKEAEKKKSWEQCWEKDPNEHCENQEECGNTSQSVHTYIALYVYIYCHHPSLVHWFSTGR